jgi:hypothetical protein
LLTLALLVVHHCVKIDLVSYETLLERNFCSFTQVITKRGRKIERDVLHLLMRIEGIFAGDLLNDGRIDPLRFAEPFCRLLLAVPAGSAGAYQGWPS